MVRRVLWMCLAISMWIGGNPFTAQALGQFPTRDFDLLEPVDDLPLYTLSNPRIEKDHFERYQYVLDYQKTREGKIDRHRMMGSIKVIARSQEKNYELNYSIFETFDSSGTLTLSAEGIPGLRKAEVFFVFEAGFTSESGRQLISNPIVVDGTSSVSARPMNEREIKGWEKQKNLRQLRIAGFNAPQSDPSPKSKAPPPKNELPSELPEGYSAIDFDTYLVPGTPVVYAHFGNWLPGELIQKDGEFMTVGAKVNLQIFRFRNPQWVMVEDEVLAKVQTEPEKYKASYHMGGQYALRNAVSARGIKLIRGMPLLREVNGGWSEVVFLRSNAEYAQVHDPIFDRKFVFPINILAVRKKTLEEAKDPEAKKRWSDRLQDRLADNFDSSPRNASGNPSGAPGTKPPRLSSAFPDWEDDIVYKPQTELVREWTDQSGKFKVKAKLIQATRSEIEIEREDGKRLSVAFNRLSEADQVFLKIWAKSTQAESERKRK
jgi:hypothetical protein